MLMENDHALDPKDFLRLSRAVHSHCGINLHDGKSALVRARMAKRLRGTGFQSASAYLDHVLSDTGRPEFANLIDALSTNLTCFFREPAHFNYLAEKFLPELLEKKHKAGNLRLRAWSAGCSTGEEPWSLAISLLNSLAGEPGWDVKVLATDISRSVLKTAQAAVYPQVRLDDVERVDRARYFQRVRSGEQVGYQVGPILKDLVRFNYLNLLEPWPFAGTFDFIFCRNVMIYFDKPTQQTLVDRFWERLEPGGLLFTGHSESLTGISHRFRYIQPTIYKKG